MSGAEPPVKRARVEGSAALDGESPSAPADVGSDEPMHVDVATAGVVTAGVVPSTATATTVTGNDKEDKEEASSRIKKRKVSIFLAYVGAGYQGFQRNPGAVTIEDELERAIVAAGGISPDNAGDFTKVGWTRAARTDKGVSAVGQSISLRMMLEHPTDQRDVIERINEKLPTGFEMFGMTRVTGGFNAKTMCDRRRYEYVIPTAAFDPAQCLPRADRADESEFVTTHETTRKASAEKFVFDETMRQRVSSVLGNYVGTHNFHNYTVRVDPEDPAAMRYILSFDCSAPFTVNGVEFVKTTVVGQSFMLHQIRKLIGAMLGVVRGHWTDDDLTFALHTRESCQAPMAPELGLFLCECIYHAYNTRFGESHEPLALEKYADKVDAFKTKFIYPHMANTESEEHTMENWIRMLPVKQVVSSFDNARRKDGGKWEAVAAAKAKTNKKKSNKGVKRKAEAEAAAGELDTETPPLTRQGPGGVSSAVDIATLDAAVEPVAVPVAEVVAEPVLPEPVVAPVVAEPTPEPTPEPVAAPVVAEPAEPLAEPVAEPTVDVPPPPVAPVAPSRVDVSVKGPPGGYAPTPADAEAPSATGGGRGGRGGGRGGRDGGRGGRSGGRGARGGRSDKGPKYEIGNGRGRGGRGGRGAPKNQMKNANRDAFFDPAELSD